MKDAPVSRRQVLAGVAATISPALAVAQSTKLRISIMSKFLQFLDIKEMAGRAREMGFDGIDLCVRAGAHVLPERVKDDLPKAFEIVRQAGLEMPMITAGIVDARSPHAEDILKTAHALGIRYYRWGGLVYQGDKSVPAQIEAFKPRVKELADLNRDCGVCAMYHTHSGLGMVGASIWDLWLLLKDFDSRWVGVNYDIGHATVEGGYGGWRNTFKLCAPHLKGIAIKDFKWDRDKRGAWLPHWVPIGQGMVNCRQYLPMLRSTGFSGSVQMHFEYPLGGVENGATKLSISNEEAFKSMRRDLDTLRAWFAEFSL